MTMQDTAVEVLRGELILRADQMSETEFSVKAQRLRNLGGYWPNGLSDWETPEGRSLSAEIKRTRAQRIGRG